MLATKQIESITKAVWDNLPNSIKNAKGDIESAIQAALRAAIAKLDLVTREELEVQVKLLEKLRQRVVKLEGQLDGLRKKASSKG